MIGLIVICLRSATILSITENFRPQWSELRLVIICLSTISEWQKTLSIQVADVFVIRVGSEKS